MSYAIAATRLSSIRPPDVIAHRGNAAEYPENTLPACESAVKAGSDLVELDYYHSVDRVPVVIHDNIELPGQRNTTAGNRQLLDSLITASRTGGEPACSGYDGMKAVEMVMAVYQSAIAKRRVTLPLKDRQHPLKLKA